MRAVIVGNDAQFVCNSHGATKWTFDDGPLPDNVKTGAGNTLKITNAQPQNEGFYICEGVDENSNEFHSRALVRVILCKSIRFTLHIRKINSIFCDPFLKIGLNMLSKIQDGMDWK